MANIKLILMSLISMIFIIPVIIALTGVIQTDNFYINNSGLAGSPLTGVRSIQYHCTDSDCSSVDNFIFDLNSGNTNSITFEYPYNPSSNQNNQDYYAHYFYKACYLPKEYVENVWGYGVSVEYDYLFNKKSGCEAEVDSFSITNTNYANEPVVIDVRTNLEADVASAFSTVENPPYYIPAGFENFYSAETLVVLEILNQDNQVIHTETKNLNIFMDSIENIQFIWTPTISGNYSARVITDVTDCQCSSSVQKETSKEFYVWPDRPQDQCYTLLNNLRAEQDGDIIKIIFDKISNYADNLFQKTPVETNLKLEIYNQSDSIIYTENFNLNANSNAADTEEFSLDWIPNSEGDYSIKITGQALDTLCDGKTNPVDVAILDFAVKALPVEIYEIVFNVFNASDNVSIEDAFVVFDNQNGFTNSNGLIDFEVEEGNYAWEISKLNFETATGNIYVDENQTINLGLIPVNQTPPINQTNQSITEINLIYPQGGEVLSEIIEVLWNATNNLGHEILISIEISSDNGLNWLTIANNISNTGSFFLDTENYANGNYILRIGAYNSIEDEIFYDQSQSFEIKNLEDEKDSGLISKSSSSFNDNICVPLWNCDSWRGCSDGFKTRECIDLNNCGISYNKPLEKVSCSVENLGNIDAINLNQKISKSFVNTNWLLLFLILGALVLIVLLIILLLKR